MDAGLAAQWNAVSRLLDEALDLDPSERAAWLANLGPEHAQAKPHVERLLRHHEARGDVSLGDALPSYSDAEISGEHLAGTVIGNYRLERLLGRGGMGAVWLAHSVDGARLPVALKLLHASAANALAERFRRERDFLAALNHPNIARLIDAGMGAGGQPWLALEFIDGGTILDYCNAKALDIRARLTLFVQALRGVQYAHANLVIHRDLKPGNMLVTPTGEVKLLDFGIAKVMDREANTAAETELTRMAGRVMTPHYASPEQIAGQPLTTASDIYSLGVVLFELLTGSRPYKLKRGSAAELEEAILNADATRPSTSVSDAFAKTQASTSSRWRRLLRGDLDTIALKAFARSPDERYASADAFAQDIERYLADRPVLARRESLAYRATRFVQRNRLAVGAAGAIVVALVVGLVAALWQAGVAREQARLAKDEAAKARTIQEFLVSIFEKNSRDQADAGRARNQTAREVLLEAAERAPAAFAASPAMKAELLATMGRLLMDVEESERAAKLLAQADALAVASGLGLSDLRVEALLDSAAANRMLGRGPEGLKARDDALAILDARGDRESLLRARATASAIAMLSRERDKEMRLVKEGTDLFARLYPTHRQRFLAVATLAQLHRTGGDLEGARVRFREAIDLFDKVGAKDFENLAAAHAWAGFCAFRVGRMSEALAESEVGVRMLGEQVGEQALSTRFHRGLRAEILHRNGQREASFRLFEELRRTAVPGKPTANEFNNAIYEADAHLREGRPARAIALLEPFSATLAEFGKRYYPNGVHWVTLLAHAHAVRGDIAEAEATLKRVDEVPRNFSSPANTMVQYALDVSWIRLVQGQPAEAWTTVTIDGDMDAPPADFSMYFVQGRVRMSEVERARGNAAAAVRMAQDALEHLQSKSYPASLPDLYAESRRALGEAHLAAGDAASALQFLEPAVESMRGLHDAASPWLADALVSLAETRSLAGDKARARAHLAEARAIYTRHAALHPRFAAHFREVAGRSQ